MYGQRGRDLLMELKGADSLPSYNDEAVRSTLAESNSLYREAVADPSAEAVTAKVFMQGVARNRRILLAYQCVCLLLRRCTRERGHPHRGAVC